MSAKASSLAVPAEQALRALSSQTPFTGTCLLHLAEFAPAFQPSQRHAYSVEVSGKASSLAVPAEQPLRTLSSHTPSTENHRAHLREFCPPPCPSQRHWYATRWSGYAAGLGVPAEQPLRTLSSQTPSTTSSMRTKQMREFCPPCRPSQRHRYALELSGTASSLGVPAVQVLRTSSWQTPSTGSCAIAGWAAQSAQLKSVLAAKVRDLTIVCHSPSCIDTVDELGRLYHHLRARLRDALYAKRLTVLG